MRPEEKEGQARRSQRLYTDLKKDQDRDNDSKRDLNTGSMQGSGSLSQKEQ